MTIGIAAAVLGLLTYNFGESAHGMAAVCSGVSCIALLWGLIENVNNSLTVQMAAIPPEQGTENRASTPSRRRAQRPASPPPAPSAPAYGESQTSPIPVPVEGRPLEGISFSLSGTMCVKRAKFIVLLQHFGATYHPTPKRGTTYLVTSINYLRDTKKMEQAERNGIQVIEESKMLDLCGLTVQEVKRNYFGIVPAEELDGKLLSEAMPKQVREYRKVAGSQRALLQELMASRGEMTLPHPVQAIVINEEELEIAKVERLKYNAAVGDYLLFTTDGEAIYLNDLRDCSVADILRAVAA